MSGEPGPDSTRELQSEQAPGAASDHLNAGSPGQPRPWGRADRKRLLIWVAIALILPGVFLFAFHSWKPTGPVFSIQSELPIKAIAAFFAVLGTWIVSRMEKRPLDDYGIPPRHAFGLRFWEGLVWGFAAVSAIVLILRVSGHFQFDSVALYKQEAQRRWYVLPAGAAYFWPSPFTKSSPFAATGSSHSPDACASGRLALGYFSSVRRRASG